MSERFPGGIISKTAPVPTGPYENGTAPGIWTLEQQAEFVRQGIWPIAGNVPNYIEDVFQTWLYTGNGSTQTINNGIDLAGKGGLTWFKERSGSTWGHALFSGIGGYLRSQSTDAVTSNSSVSNTSSGFTLNDGGARWNANGTTYASWTFREQPKFFDVVTLTADGSGNATFSHNLGATPGCVILKRTDGISSWNVWHRGLTSTNFSIQLQSTAAQADNGFAWITPGSSTVSINGGYLGPSTQWVAYLFAHNAGGFGLTGTDNVISCGSFTTDGSANATVELGWEPQWVMTKTINADGDWYMADTMRGWLGGVRPTSNQILRANSSNAETNSSVFLGTITATGFRPAMDAGTTSIYIAIRRGPMRTPTTGTSVYTSSSRTGTAGVIPRWTAGFPVDWALRKSDVTTGGGDWQAGDRLRGAVQVKPNLTEAETAASPLYTFDSMTGYSSLGATGSDTSDRSWMFRRAPGFFDEVCYTGTGVARTVTHNLTVAPELMILKGRSAGTAGYAWAVYQKDLGASNELYLNTTDAVQGSSAFNDTAPTASVFSVGAGYTNFGGNTYIAYLFASCPGVSKVGSFTGTGATQVINCGFTTGARFVLIKATSTTGNWLVWDSARGIVAGNDPYLALNSTAAEVTNTDWVDTAASGFELSNAAGNLANSNGVSYIFLAIS